MPDPSPDYDSSAALDFGNATVEQLPNPLLHASGRDVDVRSSHDSLEADSVGEELWQLARFGAPLAFSGASKLIQDMTNTIMIGRFNTLTLGAMSVCSIWTSITDIMFFSGLGQLSTLCSEADGAGNKRLVGTWLQIFLVFVTIGAIPVFVLRWWTAPILVSLGIKDELAEIAGKYAIWCQGAFLLDLWYYATKEYYAAQLIVYPDAVVDAVAIFVNMVLVGIFVYYFQWGEDGVIGAAIATTLTRLLRTVAYVLYCRFRGYHKSTWVGWSYKEICRRDRWVKLFSLVAPAALGGLAEELQFQVCATLAGRMGEVQAASNALILNVIFLFFLIAMSLGEATGIRMARFLGEGKARTAALVTKIGIAACSIGSTLAALVLAFAMEPFSRLASRDSKVQQQLMGLRWNTVLIVGLLGTFMPLANILTKSGRAWVMATIIPLCCWVVGFPSSYLLSRLDGLSGIFDGLTIGYGMAILGMFVVYCRSDWEKLMQDARGRAEVSAAPEASGRAEVSAAPEEPDPEPTGDQQN